MTAATIELEARKLEYTARGAARLCGSRRKDREAIVTALDAQFEESDKALAATRPSAVSAQDRQSQGQSLVRDRAGKLAEEARSMVFVLRTTRK